MDTAVHDLRHLYEQACGQVQCRPNSQVRALLDALDRQRGTAPQVGAQRGQAGATHHSVALDLSSNIIGSRGLAAMLQLVSAASGLHVVHLNLRGNFLANEDVVSLCAHLEGMSPPTLQTLDVSDNAISQPAGKRLQQFAQRLPTLVQLGMGNTLINIGLQHRIEAMLSKRRAALASIAPAEGPTTSPAPLHPLIATTADSSCSNPESCTAIDGQLYATVACSDNETAHDARYKASGIALVAPPHQAFRCLHSLYSHLRASIHEPSSPTHLTTVQHQPIALLMLSSRQFEDGGDDGGLPSRSATPQLRTLDGALLPATAVVDEAETPLGSIGHTLLQKRRPRGGGHARAATMDDPAASCSCSSNSVGEAVASPFHVLHVLLALPGGGVYRGVELLMDAALAHDMEIVKQHRRDDFGGSTSSAVHAGCPTLAALRVESDAMLRDPQRTALNLLLAATFGDAMPMFNDILHVPHPPALAPATSIDSPDDPRATAGGRRVSTRGSVVSLAGASSTSTHSSIALPTIVCPAHISDDNSSPNRAPVSPGNPQQTLLAGSGVDAIPSLASEGSFMSTVEPERKSNASGASREEHVQRLIRPTPWGALLGLVDLGDGLESLEQLRATIALLSPGVSASQTPAIAARSPSTPAALVGTVPVTARNDM